MMSSSERQPSNLPPFHPSNHPPFHPSNQLFDEPFLRKLERLAILSRRAMAGQLQGERRSPKRGQSVEFADFRPYAPGDDFRRIDWNAYARLERFFIKLFVEEEDLTVHLLVDTSRSMDWGQPNKLWYAVRAAGALGYIALVGLDRVTATAFGGAADGNGGYFPPRRGKGQALALFAFLQALAQPSNGSTELAKVLPTNQPIDLRQALTRYAARARQPGPLILLSDLFDSSSQPSNLPAFQPGWADGLRALASRGFEVTVLHILAPDEVNPELTGDLKLLDVETGAEVEITADYDLLGRYRDGLAAWREELRRFCGARGMHYVPVETRVPFEELLFALLRRRGVLR
jgi:uncharacterized protein (DUF58 family)